MILQSIILIDLFYLAGINLVRRYDEGQGQYACVLIILSLIAETGAISCNILGYIYFHGSTTSCSSSLWANIITSILLIIMPVIQLFHFNPQNSLLTTALVSLYVSYLAFISQFSYDAGDS